MNKCAFLFAQCGNALILLPLCAIVKISQKANDVLVGLM
jgi:hypothetical protein